MRVRWVPEGTPGTHPNHSPRLGGGFAIPGPYTSVMSHPVTHGPRPPARPRALAPGDIVAVISPSWGGPEAFPHVFEQGLRVLRGWGLEVREYPSTRETAARLGADPRLRAADVNDAFRNPAIRAILASIGGDDSIRLLPFLDLETMRANPKILMGYSDTTVLLAAGRQAGLVTFHGPSVMAGLGQLPALDPAAGRHVHDMLFGSADGSAFPVLPTMSEGYPDWRVPSLVGQVNAPVPAGPWRILQGRGVVTGELFGGCLEVLDWLRGSVAWPEPEDWAGRLLLIETSEENPTTLQVVRMLRSLGVIGVFERVAGVLVDRWRERSPGEIVELEAAIREVIGMEFGRPDLAVAANLPFGHTDPQWVLPIGVRAAMDLDGQTLRLIEPWLA